MLRALPEFARARLHGLKSCCSALIARLAIGRPGWDLFLVQNDGKLSPGRYSDLNEGLERVRHDFCVSASTLLHTARCLSTHATGWSARLQFLSLTRTIPGLRVAIISVVI